MMVVFEKMGVKSTGQVGVRQAFFARRTLKCLDSR